MLPLILLLAALAPSVDQDIEHEIFLRVNQERVRHGLHELQLDPVLSSIARTHNEDMFRRNYFAHNNPEGETSSDRISRLHRQMVGEAGENIWMAEGYTDYRAAPMGVEIMAAWMNSPAHRENILLPEFTHIGIGIVIHGKVIHAAQEFATVAGYLEKPAPSVARRGEALHLVIAGAELFDLWQGHIVYGPKPLAEARADAPPGRYIIRFYFPKTKNHFTIHSGPSIEIH